MSKEKISVSSVRKFSISVSKNTMEACDMVLTPDGFIGPPSGSYSQLINSLLNGYLESVFQTDFLTVFELMNDNPGLTTQQLKELVTASEGA